MKYHSAPAAPSSTISIGNQTPTELRRLRRRGDAEVDDVEVVLKFSSGGAAELGTAAASAAGSGAKCNTGNASSGSGGVSVRWDGSGFAGRLAGEGFERGFCGFF
ncbi:hypothetical protein [Fuerstiella marisgermanici]|uniref:hypothetical protein n=1 Tax=Fuerstiella marisgermanici TaxID=1891926 RepID=UPI00131488D5|nr:hypothetical protein [Fuerstiella marisgermanici]